MAKISKQEFIEKIKNVSSATSVRGKSYYSIQVHGLTCTGIRKDTGKLFEVDIDELYRAYKENEIINTKILKPYACRNQSPALAILVAAGLA